MRAEERGAWGAGGLQHTGVTRMTDIGNRIVEFSTELIPEQDRIPLWREHYGHVMLHVDLEPDRDKVFDACMTSLALPGLQLIEASSSPARISRRGQYLADGNDDLILAINRKGSVIVESGDRSCAASMSLLAMNRRSSSVVLSALFLRRSRVLASRKGCSATIAATASSERVA